MFISWLKGVLLVAAALACLSNVKAQWLPQKTKVIKIGFLMPFGVPYDPNDEASTLNSVVQTLNTVTVYNSLLWYINQTNNNPNVLPDTRVEVVPFNTRLDRGLTLSGALQMINQDRVAAIIGEISSRNTVTMAVATAVSKTQSNAMLIRSFNKTNIGILTSSDEFGSGMSQLLQLYAPTYNISVSLLVVYDFSKANLKDELQGFIDGAIQTIVLVASNSPIVNIMRSAQQLNMLDGSYWLISTLGWTDGMFASSADQELLKNITGTWQLQNPLYEDTVLAPDGSNADAVALRAWYSSLFNSNEADVNPGVSKTFNASTFFMPANAQTANLDFRSNCPNDTQLSVASSIPKFLISRTVNNTRVLFYGAGNMCTGQDLPLTTGYMVNKPTDYMHSTFKCSKALIGMFDYYTKTKRITVEGINNRTLMSLANGNITQLINNASLKDQWGNPLFLDSGGDLVMQQDIFIYKAVNVSSKKRVVTGVSAGKWQPTTNTIQFNNEPLLFLGGKTAPPETPTIPTIYFNAKKGMRYAFVAITAACSALTLGLLGYMIAYVKMKIFVASSPVFLGLIILGANISYIGIYLFSIYPMTDGSCVVFGWLKYMGFAVVFGALLVKTHRISVIFAGKKNKALRMGDSVLLGSFSVIVALWAALLVVWTVIPSQRPYLQTEVVANVARNGTVLSFYQTDVCNFRDYNYVCLGAMVITLAFGVWLTYLVRNTPSAFNESKWIAIGTFMNIARLNHFCRALHIPAIYNWVVIGIVLNAIANFAVKDPDVIFVMEALVVILTQTTVAVVLFVPKILEIMAGRGNNNSTFMGTTSASSEKSEKDKNQSNAHIASVIATSSEETAALTRKLEDTQRALREREVKLDEVQRALKDRDEQIKKLEATIATTKAETST
ncbi:hypothetical protein HDU96_002389 [Phlyctochytrium bullatum]|nr:hypothetical protein HDU96_002389 [Phlyctochytrium bullatum]